MNHKRLISLTMCWILIVVPGLCVLSFADIESGTDTEAEQHFEKANELRKLADYEAAITEYKKVISLSSNSRIAQDAQYWIGQSYFEAGQFDAALSAFQKLLDEYPTSKTVPTTKLMIERVQQAKKNRSLFEAAKKGDIEQVKKFISEGADVNAGSDNWTPLHEAVNADSVEVAELLTAKGAVPKDTLYYAIWNKNEEMVRLLVSKGADVNAQQEKYGWTPLHHAVFGKNFDIIKFLVDNGAKFDVKSSYGFTALRYAVFYGDRDLFAFFISKGADDSSLHAAAFMGKLSRVKDLIEQGIDVNSKDEQGWTALFWAACADQIGVSNFLIDNGADMNMGRSHEGALLHFLAQRGHLEMAKLLIDKGADMHVRNSNGRIPLQLACLSGNRDMAELLIAKDNDVSSIHMAACKGDLSRVKQFIEKGTAVDARDEIDWTALLWAAYSDRYSDRIEVAEFLIANGADVRVKSSDGRTPLHQVGSVKLADLLVSKGADVNAKDQQGYTPLHNSVNRAVAELLIARGADVNAKNNTGYTPLRYACRRGNRDIVELLIDKGADVNLQNDSGWAPLLIEAGKGNKDMVELLIAKGADINIRRSGRSDGFTPLHFAARSGQKDMVELLVAKGADTNARTNGNLTPLDLAEQNGHTEIVELLRRHGAKE